MKIFRSASLILPYLVNSSDLRENKVFSKMQSLQTFQMRGEENLQFASTKTQPSPNLKRKRRRERNMCFVDSTTFMSVCLLA